MQLADYSLVRDVESRRLFDGIVASIVCHSIFHNNVLKRTSICMIKLKTWIENRVNRKSY